MVASAVAAASAAYAPAAQHTWRQRMDALDALATPLLRAAAPDAALRRRVEEEASTLCRDLEVARRAREAQLLAHPELTRPPTDAEAAEDAWVARLTEELRGVLRASVAEHWPDAPVAAAPRKDRVPRMALELARGARVGASARARGGGGGAEVLQRQPPSV